MKSSADFLILSDRKELDTVNDYLEAAGVKEDHTGDMIEEDLDRFAVEELEREEISDALVKNAVTAIAAASRQAHEANRSRRDINIATASHKKLMMGVYRTMYQRKLKLERKIQEATNG